MTPLIEVVNANVKIVLSNGAEINIPLAVSSISNLTNYIYNIDIKESSSASNQNPVGVVSSNIVKLGIKTNNMSLIPDNELSPYYGYMDNTAVVKITLEDKDSETLGDTVFNDFYVNSWYSNISTSDPYDVVIEATDLLSIINKNAVPDSELVKNATTAQVYKNIIQKLNESLPSKYRISYDDADINFDTFPTVEITNFEADNMGTWQNILSQSTLTNIYYTRENKLKTDYCLDDTASESVCTLSDTVNILKASIDRGGLVGYSGVKVNYILNTINNMAELTQLNGQTLVPGDNTFENIDLGDKVYKINFIVVKSEYTSLCEVKSISYNKSNATIVINNPSQSNQTCNIIIYGQTIKENKQYIKMYKQNNSNGEVLEVTNRILPNNKIRTFASGLLSLIGIKGSALTIEGFLNPRIKLGDIVYVDVEQSIKTKGYYKVIELNWKIANTIKCSAKLIKTVGVT